MTYAQTEVCLSLISPPNYSSDLTCGKMHPFLDERFPNCGLTTTLCFLQYLNYYIKPPAKLNSTQKILSLLLKKYFLLCSERSPQIHLLYISTTTVTVGSDPRLRLHRKASRWEDGTDPVTCFGTWQCPDFPMWSWRCHCSTRSLELLGVLSTPEKTKPWCLFPQGSSVVLQVHGDAQKAHITCV